MQGQANLLARPLKNLHPWNVTPVQARAIHEQLRERLVRRDDFAQVETVACLDIGFEERGGITRAAVVVLRFPGLELLERALARCPTSFPYIPGLLSFREIPAALDALAKLRVKPDLLLCDGQGYAHPRRFGLACHLGLLTDLPSIGVAKSRLIGEHGTLALEKGAQTWLRHDGEIIGALLRTRAKVRPVSMCPWGIDRPGDGAGLCPGLHYPLSPTRTHPPGPPVGIGRKMTMTTKTPRLRPVQQRILIEFAKEEGSDPQALLDSLVDHFQAGPDYAAYCRRTERAERSLDEGKGTPHAQVVKALKDRLAKNGSA